MYKWLTKEALPGEPVRQEGRQGREQGSQIITEVAAVWSCKRNLAREQLSNDGQESSRQRTIFLTVKNIPAITVESMLKLGDPQKSKGIGAEHQYYLGTDRYLIKTLPRNI